MADDKVTMEQIQQEQQAIAVLSGELAKTSDVEKIEQLTAMIQSMADNLQAMCEQLVQAFKDEHPQAFDINGKPIERPVPRIEVLLTPEQRAQIQAETGVDMPSVLIEDQDGSLMRAMHQTDRDYIQGIALEKARAFIVMTKAIEAAAAERAALEAQLSDEERALFAGEGK